MEENLRGCSRDGKRKVVSVLKSVGEAGTVIGRIADFIIHPQPIQRKIRAIRAEEPSTHPGVGKQVSRK